MLNFISSSCIEVRYYGALHSMEDISVTEKGNLGEDELRESHASGKKKKKPLLLFGNILGLAFPSKTSCPGELFKQQKLVY